MSNRLSQHARQTWRLLALQRGLPSCLRRTCRCWMWLIQILSSGNIAWMLFATRILYKLSLDHHVALQSKIGKALSCCAATLFGWAICINSWHPVKLATCFEHLKKHWGGSLHQQRESNMPRLPLGGTTPTILCPPWESNPGKSGLPAKCQGYWWTPQSSWFPNFSWRNMSQNLHMESHPQLPQVFILRAGGLVIGGKGYIPRTAPQKGLWRVPPRSHPRRAWEDGRKPPQRSWPDTSYDDHPRM